MTETDSNKKQVDTVYKNEFDSLGFRTQSGSWKDRTLSLH